jgi:hypothetical protein
MVVADFGYCSCARLKNLSEGGGGTGEEGLGGGGGSLTGALCTGFTLVIIKTEISEYICFTEKC